MSERIASIGDYAVLLISNTQCTKYQPGPTIAAACALTEEGIRFKQHYIRPESNAHWQLQQCLRAQLKDKHQPVVIAVFGGDGTMSKVVNTAALYRNVLADQGSPPVTIFAHCCQGDYNVNGKTAGVSPEKMASTLTQGVIKTIPAQRITIDTDQRKGLKGIGLIGFGGTAWHVHGVEQSRKQGTPPKSRLEKLARCSIPAIKMAKTGSVTIFDNQNHTLFSGQTILTEVLNEGNFMDISVPVGEGNQRLVTVAARDKVTGILKGVAAISWSKIFPNFHNPWLQVQELPQEILLQTSEPGLAHVDGESTFGHPAHAVLLDNVTSIESQKLQQQRISFLVPPPLSRGILTP